MTTIEMKRSLREALSPHLKNLKITKAKVSHRQFADLITDFKHRLIANPEEYLKGIENTFDVKLMIESIIDEIAEN
ncbi:MAG: hypothetical protein JSU09_03990 [Bacteroidetes bacterium]|nr:hypothetical protein [Bacteroidota bacterium]